MRIIHRGVVLVGALLLVSAGGNPFSRAADKGGTTMFLSEQDVKATIGQLASKHSINEKERIERGVRQAARLWTQGDGSAAEFTSFCASGFATGKDLEALFSRLEDKFEQINGHFAELGMQLRREQDEDRGPLLPVDEMFAAFNPAAHLGDDLFGNKVAFLVLLNFPLKTLDECIREGEKWSRREWAEVRLAQAFRSRVPADVAQAITKAEAGADNYVSRLNFFMDHMLGADGKPAFREGLKLISHWGLRDELRALYVDPVANFAKQKLIQTMMERIVNQEVPQAVINNPAVRWDPVANTVDGRLSDREPDTRFATMLAVFKAHRLEDPYTPTMPSQIDRSFQRDREIPEKEVQALLEALLKAPVGKKVAALIEKRLGRKLQPFDIWYDGFKARGGISEEKLDQSVREKYPTVESFQKDLPNILGKLGFDEKTAVFLAGAIEVDPARGAGHAMEPSMRGEKAHLRTRIPEGGMNYKGFNIAVHELGHNVEQVFSLNRVDHTLLRGVPNSAFTEGFAFVFQARDMNILGVAKPDPKAEALKAIDTFWMAREIAGVGLLDVRVWHWMYDHPGATPEQLRDTVVSLAKEIWNTHYAPVFGVKDSPLLAIYSHMISYPLYLADYPLGYLMSFQVEDYFKGHPLAKEMERMCSQGRLTPNAWMKQAVGAPVSAEPLIRSAEKAAAVLEK